MSFSDDENSAYERPSEDNEFRDQEERTEIPCDYFVPASAIYDRQKYPSKKAKFDEDGGGKVWKRKESDDDADSPSWRKKVHTASYRNATGSVYNLSVMYRNMKGGVSLSPGTNGTFRAVTDGTRSPHSVSQPDRASQPDTDGPAEPQRGDSFEGRNGGLKKIGVGRRSESSSQDDEREKLAKIIETEILDSEAMNVSWKDIAGLATVKKTIQEIVVWPMLKPEIFTGLRAPPKGILLFGPPGTGKTTLGRCIASQAHATFYCISASTLTSKWVGENEKLVRALFESARLHQPAVVFVDEVDALLSNRMEGEHDSTRRLKTQFLTELDGARSTPDERILVVGATNRPGDLDDAARRRFTKRLYVPLPDQEGRMEMLGNLLASESHSLTLDDLQQIAERTEGFSCDDLKKMCQEAAFGPIRRVTDITQTSSDQLAPISMDDFEQALRTVRPSVAPEQLAQYEEFDRRFGSAGAMY